MIPILQGTACLTPFLGSVVVTFVFVEVSRKAKVDRHSLE